MSAVPVLGSAGNPGPQNPESKAKTNLIANYIPPSMSDEDVRDLFSTIGPLQSCKLIKDKQSQGSLGYAFVNFISQTDAEKAIQKLNGLPLQSKTLKVSYARPSSVQIKNANLYVAYLPKTYSQVDLEKLFRPFGDIITTKILIDTTTGLSRGVGFVRFDKHSEAEEAISNLNGTQLPGSTQGLLVKFANQSKSGSTVAGSGGMTHPSLAASSVSSATVRRGGAYGATTGGPIRHTIGNIRFNPVTAITAGATAGLAPLTTVQNLPGLATAATQPTPQGWCIFIYNLPEAAQEALLYQLFSPFGAISSVKVIKDLNTGKCKRYGFVNMVNYEEACQAIMNLNGYNYEGKVLQVSFKSTK